MRSKLLTLISCVLLAACAGEDIKETGISRDRAISIAKSACSEYPDRFSFIDRADWIPEKHFWAVEITNRAGFAGRVYKINRNGEIVGTRDISENRRRGFRDGRGPFRRGDDDEDAGPFRRNWWY